LENFIHDYGGQNKRWDAKLETSYPSAKLDITYHPNAIFTSVSPSGSFGYGPLQVRFKFRKNTKYLRPVKGLTIEACNAIPEKMKKNAVVVRVKKWGRDFLSTMEVNICNFETVHSWSFGTKKSYDEIVKEYRKFQELPDPTGKMILYFNQKMRPILFPPKSVNGHWEIGDLRNRLTDLLEKYNSKNLGKIFYNPALDRSEKENHFYSDKPLYWNSESNTKK
jgi:hypothetical protein